MFKKILDNLNISRLTYLLEIIKNKKLSKKVNAFKKLDKMKITKEMGLLILEYAKYDYNIKDGNGGINASLISLCFKNYYKEYSDVIKKMYPKLDDDCKAKIVFLLSTIDNEDALILYSELIIKYYKDSDYIPISNLYERTNSYKILFPKLFGALKFKSPKNNILVLINDYLNAGVIPESDIKKHKKLLQDSIIKIFEEGLKYKKANTFNLLSDPEYLDLRFFLEIAINIEYYVTGKKTQEYLTKLLKKHDNQLKIFILDNYIRKNKSIDRLSYTEIARDDASRYPLYEFLSIFDKTKLFPKKYLDGKELAKSDLILNIIKYNNYTELPKNIKFIKSFDYNGYLYYAFSFKYTYINNMIVDDTTNYILKETGLDKYNNKEITAEFIGISGGYNLEKTPSLIEINQNDLLVSIKRENEEINDVIDRIMFPFSKKELHKVKINRKDKKILKNVQDELEQEQLELEYEEEYVEEVKKRGFKFRFWYILLFLFIIFLGTIGVFFYVLNNPELASKTINRGYSYKSSTLVHMDEFKEIDGTEIFKRNHPSYYVLFYRKNAGKNKYYTYLDILIENGYKIYYVNLNDDKNNFLFTNNSLNFTVSEERFLKVEDGEFSFYIDGKDNILNELKGYVDDIETKEKEKEETKKKEELKKKVEANSKAVDKKK